MKRIDITDKLSENVNPVIVVYGEELEVKADAKTVLKLMGIARDSNKDDVERMLDAVELLFDKKENKKLQDIMEKKKLTFENYMTIIMAAMDAATGGNDEGKETTTQGMI